MNLKRHSGKCKVCNHEEREQIEADLRDCAPITETGRKYDIPERAIYRHLDAFKSLDDARMGNLVGWSRWLRKEYVRQGGKITATNYLEALKIEARLEGKWIDRTQEIPSEFENRTDAELEHYATHRGRWPEEDEREVQ